MIFSPTYLYIKQHAVTGKLYFGKTTRNPIKYFGSGKLWKRHINKYGKEHVITLWYQLYNNPFDLVADALSISYSLDIVNNGSWLNLMVENGLDGGIHSEKHKLRMTGENNPFYNKNHTKESKLLISKSNTGRKHSIEAIAKISISSTGSNNGMYNKKHSVESKLKMAILATGKKASEATKLKMSKSRTGKKRSDESKLKMSLASKGKPHSEQHTKNNKASQSKYLKIILQTPDDKQITLNAGEYNDYFKLMGLSKYLILRGKPSKGYEVISLILKDG